MPLTLLCTGGKFAPTPAGSLDVAQKPLGPGSWNFMTLSFTYNTFFQIVLNHLGSQMLPWQPYF